VKAEDMIVYFLNIWITNFRSIRWLPFLLVLSASAWGGITKPIKQLEEVHTNLVKTEFFPVSTAKLVYVNYILLAEDFPELVRKPVESEIEWKSRLDKWTFKYSANLRAGQLTTEDGTVNSKINVDFTKTNFGYLPPTYRRSHFMKAGSGLLDIKGSGTDNPKMASHQNGLLPLKEAFREHIIERTINAILSHAGLKNETVEAYAIIDWGFNIRHPDGNELPRK
jgi:hypothetical protein